MRFTIEEVQKRASDLGAKFRRWRATHVMPDGGSIQLHYWAINLAGAKKRVRDRYPNATFSDKAGDASHK